MKQKILFLVGTQYHMLVCLSAIADQYSDAEKYDITIWQMQTIGKERFAFDEHIAYPHVKYVLVPIASKEIGINPALKEKIELAVKASYSYFIFFNDVDVLGVHMARVLKVGGTHVILGPDGMKALTVIKRIAPRWSLKFALRYRKFRKDNQLKDGRGFYWPSMRYAYLKEIDEVWIPFVDQYVNWNSKKVTEVRVMESQAAVAAISSFFGFDPKKELKATEKVFFLIGMPAITPHFEQMNLDLVTYFAQKFDDYTFMIKLHPSATAKQRADMERIGKIEMIMTPFPAEIYIAQLKNSLIVSYWSTASLINNPTCRFYWLYPILKKQTDLLNYMNLLNPTKHIVEVDEMELVQ